VTAIKQKAKIRVKLIVIFMGSSKLFFAYLLLDGDGSVVLSGSKQIVGHVQIFRDCLSFFALIVMVFRLFCVILQGSPVVHNL
jgi:hypothetical protein